MWPGVLTISNREFKTNSTAVVYAHKALVTNYISSLQNKPKSDQAQDDEGAEDDGQAAEEQSAAQAEEEESKDPATSQSEAAA